MPLVIRQSGFLIPHSYDDLVPPRSTPSSPAAWLSHAGFVLALVLIIARGMLQQHLRDIEPVAPLGPDMPFPPLAAGVATGLVLDALCLLSAVLVAMRLAFDRGWPMRRTWSVALFAAVAIWAFSSTLWASDKFAAAASASTWLAAAALLFTVAQTVRTWSRLRICCAVAVGLFMANAAFGVSYRLVDLPQLREEWEENKVQLMQERGMQPGSFAAEQFENRLMHGQVGGFSASPNSLAATLVMLGLLTAGVAWQRWRDDTERNWAWIFLVALLPGLWILWMTGSRAAIAAGVLMTIVLLAAWPLRGILVRKRAAVFGLGCAIILLGTIGIVAVGVGMGTLPQDSLAFRWNYWVGAWGVFSERPTLGVGFANFGDFYLAHRLPVAAEEVKDPHNLIVRFFTETGMVGGLLAIGWLGFFAWELTRGTRPESDGEEPETGDRWPGHVTPLIWIVVAGLIVNTAAGVDFTSDPYFIFLQCFRLLLYGLLIVLAVLLSTARSQHSGSLLTRPAAALSATAIAAMGAVLLHTMVDLVLFEAPVLMSFVLIAGAVVGIKAPERPGRFAGLAALAVAVFGLMGFLAYAVPTISAERLAQRGDALVRWGEPARAISLYARAAERTPVSNRDYYEREAQAIMYARGDVETAGERLRRAWKVDPRAPGPLLMLADLYEKVARPPRLTEAAELYEQILELNPNDLRLRLRYAGVLEALGQVEAKKEQLQKTLDFNAQLNPDELERLTPIQVERIQAMIDG